MGKGVEVTQPIMAASNPTAQLSGEQGYLGDFIMTSGTQNGWRCLLSKAVAFIDRQINKYFLVTCRYKALSVNEPPTEADLLIYVKQVPFAAHVFEWREGETGVIVAKGFIYF